MAKDEFVMEIMQLLCWPGRALMATPLPRAPTGLHHVAIEGNGF